MPDPSWGRQQWEGRACRCQRSNSRAPAARCPCEGCTPTSHGQEVQPAANQTTTQKKNSHRVHTKHLQGVGSSLSACVVAECTFWPCHPSADHGVLPRSPTQRGATPGVNLLARHVSWRTMRPSITLS
eukprot:359717-Chlamydomonas_euryale.AAC.1